MSIIPIASLLISLASLLAALASVCIALSSLRQAERIADRERQNWKQRTWFDLYLKANEAYDFFDYFQGKYRNQNLAALPEGMQEYAEEWNHLMGLMRHTHAMAAVFPKNSAIDELFSSTAVFKTQSEALSEDRLSKVLNAVQGLRQKALLDPDIL